MEVSLKKEGKLNKLQTYLINSQKKISISKVESIAIETVNKLKKASPYESIAEAWDYEIKRLKNGISLIFTNSNVNDGVNIAILVDSGYATQNGQWVTGYHYIDEPIEEACEELMKQTKGELIKNL